MDTTSVVEQEPQEAETFGRSRYTEVSTPASGQTKVAYSIIIHIELDQKSELSRYSF